MLRVVVVVRVTVIKRVNVRVRMGECEGEGKDDSVG